MDYLIYFFKTVSSINLNSPEHASSLFTKLLAEIIAIPFVNLIILVLISNLSPGKIFFLYLMLFA
tara:strand:- start:16 stop:210 length:195 start_codon:yes stop_codon:yes gene_type:complete